MISMLPRFAKWVTGSLSTGRLVLIAEDGFSRDCDVLMCLGTLVDNEDCTFDIVFPTS